jgi:tetratricopeptide (TPR) repeat protein
MKSMLKPLSIVMIVLSTFSFSAWPNVSIDIETQDLADRWAAVTYTQGKESRKSGLKKLTAQAESLLSSYPVDENLLTWAGIVTASYAGEVGGLKALGIVKKAKKHLEKAITINPDALNGGARTTLGTLYFQVPGWPIGFGNKEKAEKLLAESAKLFPNNLNTLYFFGSFLIDSKRYTEALSVMNRAASITPRENSLIADNGRLAQIHETISSLENK